MNEKFKCTFQNKDDNDLSILLPFFGPANSASFQSSLVNVVKDSLATFTFKAFYSQQGVRGCGIGTVEKTPILTFSMPKKILENS